MHVGYILLPENVSRAFADELKSQIPENLLAYVDLNKENNSLVHSLAGRYVLSKLLEWCGLDCGHITMSVSVNHRPEMNIGWGFSISHSGSIAVCVLSKGMAVGIDVELMNTVVVDDFKHFFTEKEFTDILNDLSHRTFYKLWTAKEAIGKAIGEGVLADFKAIAAVADHEYRWENKQWYTTDIDIDPGYYCTLAAPAQVSAIQLQRFEIV